LLAAGIVYYPVRCEHQHNGTRAECSLTVRFVNIDDPADFFDVPTFGYGIDPQDKGPGKAMSYAVKYALLKALGLETGDDPDMDSIPHSQSDPAIPPFDPVAAHDRIAKKLEAVTSLTSLAEAWKDENGVIKEIELARADLGKSLTETKDRRKAELQEKV
jgi:ERF superfamily